MSSWFVVVALLLLIGWATRTLGSFDPRVVLAWVLATPVALFAARALMPVVLVRLLAAEGVQRIAVIAAKASLAASSPNGSGPPRFSESVSPAFSTIAAPNA